MKSAYKSRSTYVAGMSTTSVILEKLKSLMYDIQPVSYSIGIIPIQSLK